MKHKEILGTNTHLQSLYLKTQDMAESLIV